MSKLFFGASNICPTVSGQKGPTFKVISAKEGEVVGAVSCKANLKCGELRSFKTGMKEFVGDIVSAQKISDNKTLFTVSGGKYIPKKGENIMSWSVGEGICGPKAKKGASTGSISSILPSGVSSFVSSVPTWAWIVGGAAIVLLVIKK